MWSGECRCSDSYCDWSCGLLSSSLGVPCCLGILTWTVSFFFFWLMVSLLLWPICKCYSIHIYIPCYLVTLFEHLYAYLWSCLLQSFKKYFSLSFLRGMLNKFLKSSLSHSSLSFGTSKLRGKLFYKKVIWWLILDFSALCGLLWLIGCFTLQVGNPSRLVRGQNWTNSPRSSFFSLLFNGTGVTEPRASCMPGQALCH